MLDYSALVTADTDDTNVRFTTMQRNIKRLFVSPNGRHYTPSDGLSDTIGTTPGRQRLCSCHASVYETLSVVMHCVSLLPTWYGDPWHGSTMV